MAQFIVIVQILIAKRNAMNALADKRLDAVLDPVLSAAVPEAGRLRDRLMARSVSRSSSAPALEVIAPPSNAAVTLRLLRLAKSRESGYTLSASARSPASGKSFVAEEFR